MNTNDLVHAYYQDGGSENPEDFFVAMEQSGEWDIHGKKQAEPLDKSVATLLASKDNEKFVKALCFLASPAGDRMRKENSTLINMICASIPFVMVHKDGDCARPYWAGLKELDKHPDDWKLEFPVDWVERKNGAIVSFLQRRGLMPEGVNR